MVSRIGWIDLSPLQRNRVKKFMDLMGMGGVQDELGVGMIRDAMSNRIFPGFSTLYTRAKYFFITPYILLDIDTKKKRKQSNTDYFRKAEIEANKVVIEFYENNPDRMGESYFGKDKKDGQLKRQPSEIYWNGITTLHLVDTNGTLDQLLRDRQSTMEELLSNNRGDEVTREQGERDGRNAAFVSYSADWLDEIRRNGLTLNAIEADTLRDRLKQYTPDGLPAALVFNSRLWDLYKAAATASKADKSMDNPMIHFIKSAYKDIENEELRKNLIAAHDMSLFLYGPHIAYNIRIWSKAGASKDFINQHRDEGIRWLGSLKQRMIDYDHFNIDDCMAGSNIKPVTKTFLEEVQEVVHKSTDWVVIEDELCNLAERQERWNKKSKSRFVKLDKKQVIDEMGKEQWLSLGLINYRYAATLSVVKDIYEGLNNTNE